MAIKGNSFVFIKLIYLFTLHPCNNPFLPLLPVQHSVREDVLSSKVTLKQGYRYRPRSVGREMATVRGGCGRGIGQRRRDLLARGPTSKEDAEIPSLESGL